MTTLKLSPTELLGEARAILMALGTPDDIAEVVANSLVDGQLAGHDSHGVIRLVEYAEFVKRGTVRPAARPVVAERGATATVDGQSGWGQYASFVAVRTARDLVARYGCATVTISRANHLGRLGEYVESLAIDGLVGLAWCNADPTVAPFGGISRLLGTNPIAAGVPLGAESPPLVLDFATSAVAEGKLRVARAVGESIPPGLIIDAQGRTSEDPNAFYDGGALLPFGGHKGYALSVVIEMLGGALSGNHPGTSAEYVSGNGGVLIVLDPGFFVDPATFIRETGECARALRESPAATPGGAVLVPGDIENRTRQERSTSVPVPEEIWAELQALHRSLLD